jgi:His-Xaa-Ser system protein HxsD
MLERELTFDPAAASVDAIQRAAYRLSDRLSIDLAIGDRRIDCVAHIESEDVAEAEAVVAELRKQVLDEVLRERIREETAEVRNVILSLAFSQTGLSDQG